MEPQTLVYSVSECLEYFTVEPSVLRMSIQLVHHLDEILACCTHLHYIISNPAASMKSGVQ